MSRGISHLCFCMIVLGCLSCSDDISSVLSHTYCAIMTYLIIIHKYPLLAIDLFHRQQRDREVVIVVVLRARCHEILDQHPTRPLPRLAQTPRHRWCRRNTPRRLFQSARCSRRAAAHPRRRFFLSHELKCQHPSRRHAHTHTHHQHIPRCTHRWR